MPFLPQRNLSFPAFCILRVMHCLNTLACWSLFSGNFPWGFDHREAPHNHREGQTNTQKFVQSCFLFRRDPVSLGLSGNFLENVGTHPECEPGYQTLVAKFTFYSRLAPQRCGLTTAWKSSQLLFSYCDGNSFGPPTGISEPSGRLATPSHRTTSSGMSPRLGNHSMALTTLSKKRAI